MSASVRISLKLARALLIVAPSYVIAGELQAAVDRATRASTTRRRLATPKRAKEATKRLQTRDIRAEVVERAQALCELCGSFSALDLHHALGRGKAQQSVSNCLGICRDCHDEIHASPRVMLLRQADVFLALGHPSTATALRKKLAWLEARGGGA